MITAMATAIGAVGPEICDRVPPNTAAKNPTAIAPYRPAAAPNPDATPKASETGSATTAEVRPPKRSPRSVSRSYFTGYTVAIRIPSPVVIAERVTPTQLFPQALSGEDAHRPPDRVAGGSAADADLEGGDRMQAAARQPGSDRTHRAGADERLPGPLRRR